MSIGFHQTICPKCRHAVAIADGVCTICGQTLPPVPVVVLVDRAVPVQRAA